MTNGEILRYEFTTTVGHLLKSHFAFWRDLPDFDFDAEYRLFLDQIAEADDSRISMTALGFLAKLRNSHTDLYDELVWEQGGKSFGFYARYLDEEWIVTNSRLPNVPVGVAIKAIDGAPIGEFAERIRRFIPASSRRTADSLVFARRFLFPDRFCVTLDNGDEIACLRLAPSSAATDHERCKVLDGIPVITVRSFDGDEAESQLLSSLNAHRAAPSLILDVRGNGGGNTPMAAIRALMDRPYRMWTEVSNCTLSSHLAGETASNMRGKPHDLRDTPYLVVPSPMHEPEDHAYRGRLIVLTDEYCMSSAEDFLLPLSQNGRATFVGGPTGGSSGQPYVRRLTEHITLRVGAKKQIFPSGETFEGVGFMPHIWAQPTKEDVATGADAALQAALELSATRL